MGSLSGVSVGVCVWYFSVSVGKWYMRNGISSEELCCAVWEAEPEVHRGGGGGERGKNWVFAWKGTG